MKKKAQLELGGTILEFYSVVVWVLIILLFTFVFQIRSCNAEQEDKTTIEGEIANIDSNIILLNYLKTPINVEGINMTMADLISKNPTNRKLIQDKTEEIFKDFKDKPFEVLVEINFYKFSCRNVGHSFCASIGHKTNTIIPSLNGNPTNVGLCFWRGDEKNKIREYECNKIS